MSGEVTRRPMPGRTFSEFVNEVRIGHARRMRIKTDRTISEVAYASGFESLSNFNFRFCEVAGIRPCEFRRQHQGG